MEDASYSVEQQLLQRSLPLHAIFDGSDLVAIGVMKALEEAGLSVPHDVSVIGFDNIHISFYTRFPYNSKASHRIGRKRIEICSSCGGSTPQK